MSIARKLLLAMSTNAWLRERATKTAFVRRSVSTFMPGERLEDALAAAAAQQEFETNIAMVRQMARSYMGASMQQEKQADPA